jgi:hypothetical protein
VLPQGHAAAAWPSWAAGTYEAKQGQVNAVRLMLAFCDTAHDKAGSCCVDVY